MGDQVLFLQTLSRFARMLPTSYDVEAVLGELTESSTAVLGLSGSGVSLANDDALRFVSAVSTPAAEMERVQEEFQAGPCMDAYRSGLPVSVVDVRLDRERWPEFSAVAERLGVGGVAGVPMRLADSAIGALNLYVTEPREWSQDDLDVAMVLADVATSYIVNVSKRAQQEQLSTQLQEALAGRAVIEQAKGIVAAQRGVGVESAFELIRRHARSNNASLRAVADAVVAVGLRV